MVSCGAKFENDFVILLRVAKSGMVQYPTVVFGLVASGLEQGKSILFLLNSHVWFSALECCRVKFSRVRSGEIIFSSLDYRSTA